LNELLGDRLEAIYLYGSQARGEARLDSDIDVMITNTGIPPYCSMFAGKECRYDRARGVVGESA
jgi:predicted nucleotidyltransferase